MAGYFSYIPKTAYSLNEDNLSPSFVTNILARSVFIREVAENTAIYYEYQTQEGDTPEIIADKLYNDSNRAWIVLLFNKIDNPFYEFPLNNTALEKYIIKKYNQTIDQAKTTIHHYEQEVTRNYFKNGIIVSKNVDTYIVNEYDVNYTTGAVIPRSVPGTADTELTPVTETSNLFSDGGYVQNIYKVKAISNHTHEINENEKRRNIRLLDASYVLQVENEFKKLMGAV